MAHFIDHDSLAIACIIIAFSQPYLSNQTAEKNSSETVVYLDNSFSMQAIGPKGSLLNRAVQDVMTGFDETEKIGVFTNDQSYKSTSIKDLKTDLLSLRIQSKSVGFKHLNSKRESTVLRFQNKFKDTCARL